MRLKTVRRLITPLALAGALAFAAASTVAAAAVSPLPPGWAPGGTATDPASQVAADTACGANSVLLFSARGSGDRYGASFAQNKVGAWTQLLGNVLGNWGWQVRDLQAIYPAPPVPSFGAIARAALVGGVLGGGGGAAAAIALVGKDFRDAVSTSAPAVKRELEAAYARCPGREILLAGYSQGAILLRTIVPDLPAPILSRIVSVDLFADPTEQRAVDSGLQHPSKLDGRLTTDGVDTWAASATHARNFRQRAYPASLRSRVYQYCVEGDLVCDFSASDLDPRNVAIEGKIHASYGFGTVGVAAAYRLGRYGAAPMPLCRNQLLYAAAAAKEHLDPHDPGYGPGSFGITISPVATGAICVEGWAVALVSRPNVGTTDGFTLFQAQSGHWVEVGTLGGSLAACGIERTYGVHVPTAVALKLARGQVHSGIAGC